MHEAFRPTVEQWELFCNIRDYVQANREEFDEAREYLARTYSLNAIGSRDRREEETFLGKEMARLHRKPPAGLLKHRRSPLNGPYIRLIRFVRDQHRRDLSSLGDRERDIWARRVLYVTWLITDPDAGERGLLADDFLKTPWDDKKRPLGRWWCREAVFTGALREDWTYLATMALLSLNRKPRARRGRGDWLPTALLLVRDHPDWSNKRIAKAVGIDPSALSRSPVYERGAEKARARGDVKRGFVKRTADGGVEIEAIDEQDELGAEGNDDDDSQSNDW